MSKKKTDAVKVKVGGVVANGKGGFYREGTELPDDVSDETLKSLKAKGYI